MFTGIVQSIGEIAAIDKNGDWTVEIVADELALDKTAIGASVACNGICLTVIEISPGVIPDKFATTTSGREFDPESHVGRKTKWDSGSNFETRRASQNLSGMTRGEFKVQVSAETLSCTTALHWKPGLKLNIEPALHAGDELGGHIVSGHIDGIARLKKKSRESDSLRCVFEVPHEFGKFIARKGSIALDGVSLTVNEAVGNRFGVNLIPYTIAHTTLGALDTGAEANFEVDLMARYIERMLLPPGGGGKS